MMTVGIDEVGRGCWAGPLVAGAVILSQPLAGLKDSKQLSETRRETLAVQINSEALAVGLGWATPREVDELGLTSAVGLAMHRALAEIKLGYDKIIIDGNYNYFPEDNRARAVVKADASVACVSAASIVAKVARDKYMSELSEKYSGYEFASHVGYGTASHRAALARLGVSDIHRLSYKPIKTLLA